MSKIDPTLFSAHEHALERDYPPCPLCGGRLIVRYGKHGPFLGCAAYPVCDHIRPLTTLNIELQKVLEGSSCPDCGQLLAIKKGRYGLFIGCTQYPMCSHIESQEDVEASNVLCPECGTGHLVSRMSRYGKVFFACDAFPRCKYVVNDKPVPKGCPQCGWSILIERQTRHGLKLCCPQKLCDYQTDL